MTKLLLNYLLIYAIITVITAILILWRSDAHERSAPHPEASGRGRKDRNIILIIAGASAIAILLFYLFYIPALNKAKPTQLPPLSEATQPPEHRSDREYPPERSEQTQQTQPELLSEIKGPFPTDNTVTEKERQIGRMFNIWRQSVLTRNIAQINQLDSQIKACGDEAIPFLRKLAKEDKNERVRAFAVRILGRQNKADLLGLFMELLKNDASAFVRENSCWSLGRLKNIDALDILQKVADSDSSEPVRQAAEEAISHLKPSSK